MNFAPDPERGIHDSTRRAQASFGTCGLAGFDPFDDGPLLISQTLRPALAGIGAIDRDRGRPTVADVVHPDGATKGGQPIRAH